MNYLKQFTPHPVLYRRQNNTTQHKLIDACRLIIDFNPDSTWTTQLTITNKQFTQGLESWPYCWSEKKLILVSSLLLSGLTFTHFRHFKWAKSYLPTKDVTNIILPHSKILSIIFDVQYSNIGDNNISFIL